MGKNIVSFSKKDVKEYLDNCIIDWRTKKEQGSKIAEYYIDAYQSVRTSIFGEKKDGTN